MKTSYPVPFSLQLPVELTEVILNAAVAMAKDAHKAYRISNRKRIGQTLRPGKETPLWNELRKQLRRHLRKYGDQANLGRMVGLPRQRVNAYMTQGTQMPDAERTLQMLAWLMATQQGKRPS